jgi:hypothetical protein
VEVPPRHHKNYNNHTLLVHRISFHSCVHVIYIESVVHMIYYAEKDREKKDNVWGKMSATSYPPKKE